MTDGTGIPGLGEFLCEYPQMAVRPSAGDGCLLMGRFAFTARSQEKREITDTFSLRIQIPSQFPRSLPRVIETAQKIPRNGAYHVNQDGTLCLGSPLRLMLKLS